jgi:hypothetical protein
MLLPHAIYSTRKNNGCYISSIDFPFFVKLTMLPIPPTNLFFVRHVAPYFPTVSYPLILKGLKSHVVTLRVKSLEWGCYWNHACTQLPLVKTFILVTPLSSSCFALHIWVPCYYIILVTINYFIYFYIFIWFSIIDHYLCQCQI